MVICLVGMTSIMLAVMQIAEIGKDSITNLTEPREQADRRMLNNSSANEGDYIQDWGNGADELRYTNDDEKTGSDNDDSISAFQDQISVPLDLGFQMQSWGMSSNDEFTPLIDENSKLEAANLQEGFKSSTVDVEQFLQNTLRMGSEIYLEDKVYMPEIEFE